MLKQVKTKLTKGRAKLLTYKAYEKKENDKNTAYDAKEKAKDVT